MKRTSQITNPAARALLLVMSLVVAARSQDSKPAAPAPGRRVIVSIPDRQLAIVEAGHVLRIFPVAVGAAVSPSPSGEFEIVNRITDPTYYHPGIVIPAGPNSPIGTRWVGLNKKGYGIHGTNVPSSVGHAASHGCIRMRNRDIEQFFAMVSVGDAVEIRADRDADVAAIFNPSEPQTVAEAETVAAGGGQ